MIVQSVLMSRGVYRNVKLARAAVKRAGFEGLDVDIKPEHYRFRQAEPDPSKRYLTVSRPGIPGMQLVIML